MTLKRKLAICAAGALALTGTGSALAAKGHGAMFGSSPSRADHPGGPADDLAAAAAYLGLTQAELQADHAAGKTLAQVAAATSGKSVDGLVAALVAAEKTELDAAVAAGKLTAAQESSIVSTLQQRVTDLVNGVRPAGGPRGGPGFGPGHGRGDQLAAAAAYLGLTQAELQADHAAGKTLAQVAAATSGKSVDGLVAALVAAEKTELDAAVAAGKLTAAQESSIVSTLQQRVTDFVNGVAPAGRGPHGPGDGFRP